MANADRALILEVLINRNGEKTPADVAKVLRQIADHLDDDFTDTEDNGELRVGVSHWVHDMEREDPDSDGDALIVGYWDVRQ